MSSELITSFFNGNRRALARILTIVDNQIDGYLSILDSLYEKTGNTHIIGFTGPPGAGKSTLVNATIRELRRRGKSVAVLAVDPSSPYTQGALLGDRIRMLDFTNDSQVFIRSLASRGQLGGLSGSTGDCITVLDAFGFNYILLETVGAGQSEVDIVKNCDTTIVLSVPGLGDEIQIIKAGIMEIADIFVVNKSDKIGSKELAVQIKNVIQNPVEQEWQAKVFLSNALQNDGVKEIVDRIEQHHQHLREKDLKKNRIDRLSDNLFLKFIEMVRVEDGFKDLLEKSSRELLNGETSVKEILAKLRSNF